MDACLPPPSPPPPPMSRALWFFCAHVARMACLPVAFCVSVGTWVLLDTIPLLFACHCRCREIKRQRVLAERAQRRALEFFVDAELARAHRVFGGMAAFARRRREKRERRQRALAIALARWRSAQKSAVFQRWVLATGHAHTQIVCYAWLRAGKEGEFRTRRSRLPSGPFALFLPCHSPPPLSLSLPPMFRSLALSLSFCQSPLFLFALLALRAARTSCVLRGCQETVCMLSPSPRFPPASLPLPSRGQLVGFR